MMMLHSLIFMKGTKYIINVVQNFHIFKSTFILAYLNARVVSGILILKAMRQRLIMIMT